MPNDLTPELDNFQEIDDLLSSELQSQRDRGMGKGLKNLIMSIVNSRLAIGSLKSNLTSITTEITGLNNNIKTASESSDKLTEAIKRITFWGTIIAGGGVLVALMSFIFEILKYFHVF